MLFNKNRIAHIKIGNKTVFISSAKKPHFVYYTISYATYRRFVEGNSNEKRRKKVAKEILKTEHKKNKGVYEVSSSGAKIISDKVTDVRTPENLK